MICYNCGNQIDVGKQYCGKCGNYVGNNINYNNMSNNYRFNNFYNPKKKFPTWVIVTVIIIQLGLWVTVGTFVYNKNDKYYYTYNTYDDEYSQSEDYPDIDDNNNYNPPIIDDDNTYTGNGTTKIVYNHIYNGVKISGKSDANKLIEKDSISQKGSCPSDIKKVEDELISKYNITAVNLCEMDSRYARELGDVIQKIYNEFPNSRGYITNMTLYNTGMSESGVIAAFMPIFQFATSDTSSTYPWVIKTHLLLSARYFLNPELLQSDINASSSQGHFPSNSNIYSPVAHELGHYLSFLAMMKHYNSDSILIIDEKNISKYYKLMQDFSGGNYSLEMITEAYNNYKRDTGSQIGLDEWRGTISGYALAKDNAGNYIYDETIAEAFHDTYLNGNNAKDASKYIVNVLKSKLN